MHIPSASSASWHVAHDPTVTDSFLVTLGPKCHVHCLDPKSGAVRWRMSLVDEFNAEVPPWYAGQCPLVDGGRVILATGGDALLVAVDGGTGQVIWRSPNPLNWQMTHSSVMPIEFQGKRQYVYCASGGVAGIDAADSAIWHTNLEDRDRQRADAGPRGREACSCAAAVPAA